MLRNLRFIFIVRITNLIIVIIHSFSHLRLVFIIRVRLVGDLLLLLGCLRHHLKLRVWKMGSFIRELFGIGLGLIITLLFLSLFPF